ncbi:hypothetical protein [Rhizobium ruizarguesonis]|uniref:hypothetical protein n=1 Tax=Rhizobium ruizarguesonis TaxID=2081791 RepID=UPI0013BF37B6|nr:hypothetical protein [Rhizobium ruizarguesonis]NEJ02556.1 hypothetical protein [Rhizobium ruizarguesonis]NEJ39684.1 hypothetical protein [Rhizobium ruizarguesonis]
MLRGNAAVAEVANIFCKMIAQPGFRPEVGSELYILAKTLRNAPPLGKYMIGLASGQMHEALLRQASGTAERRFIIASDRLGNAAFANAIVPAEVFQKRTGMTPLVVYGQNVGAVTGPTAAAGIAEEAKGRGVHIICPAQGFHAKFLLWGDTDIVITSLNWGSATVSPNTPYAEVGIHLQGPGLVEQFLMRLKPAWTFLDQG